MSSTISLGRKFPSNDVSQALKIIQIAINRASFDDQQDVFDLLQSVSGADEEERSRIGQMICEILLGGGTPAKKIKRVSLTAMSPEKSMKQWLSFVSARIKESRDSAGLTQDELAKKSGLQQAHISRLEKGEHSPTRKTLEKIAAATNVSVAYFDPSYQGEEADS